LLSACNEWEINTRDRLSAFLAQTGTESGSFKWWREFTRGMNPDGTPKPFNGWYGRGPMQLTWEENYQNFQNATGHPAHDNREIVADEAEVGFASAGWFWNSRNLNGLADQATWESFYEITGLVWGQAGPFHERDARYDHAWRVLPPDLDLALSIQVLRDDGDQEKTNFDIGLEYLTPAMENVPYWFWPPELDIVPDGVGAYAIDAPAPPIQDVINGGNVTVNGVDQGLGFQRGIFCAGVVNLIRRANRKTVPKEPTGDSRYDGGTWACQNFWHLYMEQFNIYSVYPRGTLVGRYFEWEGAPGHSRVVDQGHVAVLWDEHNLAEQKDAWVVQSHPGVGGLDWNTRLTESHAGGYYHYAIRPEDWINHDKGGI
jgi:putative chitinase